MHNEVIESAKYPKITFKSVSVSDVKQTGNNSYSFTLNGDLTLHGVTKRIALTVNVKVTPQQLTATGKYALKQTDFGMKPYSGGLGMIRIGDEVKVNFVVVAKSS